MFLGAPISVIVHFYFLGELLMVVLVPPSRSLSPWTQGVLMRLLLQ
jgi:hypothetical protein